MKKLALFVPALCLTALSISGTAAKADTVQLISASAASSGGEYIYPYSFSINGSSTITTLECIDLNNEITVGETWNVDITSIPTTGPNAAAYEEEAYIFSQYGQGTYTDSEVQWAAWDIFAPGDNGNAAFDANSMALVNSAVAAVTTGPGLSSAFLSQYALYLPTADETGWTDGTPQSLIGLVDPVPEPSSFVLLGSGLVGIAGAVRRRLARL